MLIPYTTCPTRCAHVHRSSQPIRGSNRAHCTFTRGWSSRCMSININQNYNYLQISLERSIIFNKDEAINLKLNTVKFQGPSSSQQMKNTSFKYPYISSQMTKGYRETVYLSRVERIKPFLSPWEFVWRARSEGLDEIQVISSFTL